MQRGKFTQERAEEILRHMRGGAGISRAAEIAGVTRQTAYNWRREGEAAGRGAKYNFHREVSRIEASNIGAAEQVVMLSMTNQADPKTRLNAATWFLERRAPSEYGRHDKLTIDHGDIARQFLDYLRDRLDADTFDRVLAALAPDIGSDPAPLQLVE